MQNGVIIIIIIVHSAMYLCSLLLSLPFAIYRAKSGAAITCSFSPQVDLRIAKRPLWAQQVVRNVKRIRYSYILMNFIH